MNVVQVIQTRKILKHIEKKNLNLFLRKGRKEGWKVILKMDVVLSAARETILLVFFLRPGWLIHIKPFQLPGQSIIKLVAKKQKSLFYLVC